MAILNESTINGNSIPSIVEQNTFESGYYRIWDNGLVEIFGNSTFTNINATTNNYSGYYYTTGPVISLPNIQCKTLLCCIINGGSGDRINNIKLSFCTITTSNANRLKYYIYGLQKTDTSVSGVVYFYIAAMK